MSDDNKGLVSLTKPVILDFPNIFEPRAIGKKGKEQGKPKYSANFIFPADHPDLKVLVSAAKEVASAQWPGRELKSLKFPFEKGEKAAERAKAKGKDGDYLLGTTVMVSRSQYEPRLSVIENKKLVELEGPARVAAKSKFYRGVEVLAQFNLVPYDGVGGNPDGVTAYLNMICSLNQGKRMAGGASAAEVFKGYAGAVSGEDPTGGEDDDEIPY